MRSSAVSHYACPVCGLPLTLTTEAGSESEVTRGSLHDAAGHRFAVLDGIPDFTWPTSLAMSDEAARREYDRTASTYDANLAYLFDSFHEDETAVREALADSLGIQPSHRVLEMGCGTGQDSVFFAKRLGPQGSLFLQDLSRPMVEEARRKLAGQACSVEFATANGAYLPFPDRQFDIAFHFGGINTFAEVGRAFREMARVTRIGGKVVIGDESMPPWLRDTEFGRVLMNTNPLYRYSLPLEHLPECARDVKVRWIIGGVFYVIEFTVGEGAPPVDYDLPIPGRRGGTHRTRYYGQLEGVSPEVKELALKAAAQAGMSVHDWLDKVVGQAASAHLDNT